MCYKKSYKGGKGFTKLVSIGDADLKLIEFGMLELLAGQSFFMKSDDFENALIVLGGKCAVEGDGFSFKEVGARKDVFSGKPHTVYIPRHKSYKITALTDMDLAWTASPASKDAAAYVIAPEQVKEAHLGKENFQRDALLMLTDAFPSEHLFIGEAYVPSGNQASYPPHRHEVDNLPVEVSMEELYFFRFNPKQGYGIQSIYTDDRSIDFTCQVHENDATLIPRGYHPVVNSPGYTMWYLWIMAGESNRKFLSVMDPAHKWVVAK